MDWKSISGIAQRFGPPVFRCERRRHALLRRHNCEEVNVPTEANSNDRRKTHIFAGEAILNRDEAKTRALLPSSRYLSLTMKTESICGRREQWEGLSLSQMWNSASYIDPTAL